MAIAKTFQNTPFLPNFNTDPFLTSELILEGYYAFVLLLQRIYIFTYVEINKNTLLDVKIYNSLI